MKNNQESGYVWVPYIMSTSVTVISESDEYMKRIKNEVTQENRNRAIDSILEDSEFNPMKVEEHPDYYQPKKMLKSRYSVVNPNYTEIKKEGF